MNISRMFVLRFVQKRYPDAVTRIVASKSGDKCEVGLSDFAFSILGKGKNWGECLDDYKNYLEKIGRAK